jgi:hypothetical protein
MTESRYHSVVTILLPFPMMARGQSLQPLQGWDLVGGRVPRVARGAQPWAGGRYAFSVFAGSFILSVDSVNSVGKIANSAQMTDSSLGG